MKILFDHQIFESQKFGGVSKYFYKLFDAMADIEEMRYELAVLYSNNGYLKELEGLHYLPLPERPLSYNHNQANKAFIIKKYLDRYFYLRKLEKYHQKNINHSLQQVREGDYDVFHPTFYDEYFLGTIKDKPYVLTIHDLTHQIFPEYFSPGWIDKSNDIIQRASRLIAVSENTKKDLMEYYSVPSEKIDVIHLASSIASPAPQSELLTPTPIAGKYLLFVGSRESYKNFYFFVRAIVPLLHQDADLHLVCTGSEFSEQEQFFFNKLGIANRVKQIFVSESSLSHWYTHAQAFIFPSLYEGFGMPILEAFACGCPVICSQASSFPEIAGDAALYFQPKDKQSIYQAISQVLNDQALRQQLIANGYQRLSHFSWSTTLAKTKASYEKAMIG